MGGDHNGLLGAIGIGGLLAILGGPILVFFVLFYALTFIYAVIQALLPVLLMLTVVAGIVLLERWLLKDPKQTKDEGPHDPA